MKLIFSAVVSLMSCVSLADFRAQSEYLDHHFGRVRVHSSEYARFQISNDLDAPAVLKEFNSYGASYYAMTNCPKELHKGEKCIVDIRFTPIRVGFTSGRVELIYEDGNNIYFNLTGDGFQF